MHERDANIVTSSLSGMVIDQNPTVKVNIIRLKNETGWSPEVENDHGTSTVLNDLFATDYDWQRHVSAWQITYSLCADH